MLKSPGIAEVSHGEGENYRFLARTGPRRLSLDTDPVMNGNILNSEFSRPKHYSLAPEIVEKETVKQEFLASIFLFSVQKN